MNTLSDTDNNFQSDHFTNDVSDTIYGAKPDKIHPDNFPIFLDLKEIHKLDEYKEGDPYKVKLGLQSDFQQSRIKATLSLIQNIIGSRKHPKILDIACGEAHITNKIKQLIPQAEVAGFDGSVSAIRYAVAKFVDIDFCVADALNLPYKKNFFDIVVCNNIWEHVTNPMQLLSEIKRILKPGGYLIVSTPNRYRIENIYNLLKGRSVALMSQHHLTEYTLGQVVEQMSWGGFDVIKCVTPHIKRDTSTKERFTVYKIIAPTIGFFLRKIKLNHPLGSTNFFLSKKRLSDHDLETKKFTWKKESDKKNILFIRSGSNKLSNMILQKIYDYYEVPEIDVLCNAKNKSDFSGALHINHFFMYDRTSVFEPDKMLDIIKKINQKSYDFVFFLLNSNDFSKSNNIIEIVESIQQGIKIACLNSSNEPDIFFWN